jgi:hypothetical protein
MGLFACAFIAIYTIILLFPTVGLPVIYRVFCLFEVNGFTVTLEPKPVVLVGKGVCYDTGGINLKKGNSLRTMKADMGGSAIALGTFLSLFLQRKFSRSVALHLEFLTLS